MLGTSVKLSAAALLLCTLIPACDSPQKPPAPRPPEDAAGDPASVSAPELAAARIDLAKSALKRNAPDEALPLLVSALEADPASGAALALVTELLAKTRWPLPETTIQTGRPVDHIAFSAPASLWVSLSGSENTTLRWNLESLRIENILFPLQAPATRSLVFDKRHDFVVVERAGITLLCNARTLKPIRDIGPLPPDATPSSVLVFSDDGLLLAHPVVTSDRSIVWHLRDTATGQILRSSEPSKPQNPQPLSAFLDREKLRVLHGDGSLLEIPVSPVAPIQTIPPAEPMTLRHALFSENGDSALILRDKGPHQPPEPLFVSYGNDDDTRFDSAVLLERFPWSTQPGVWTGLLREADFLPFKIDGPTLTFLSGDQAPVHADAKITALDFDGDRIFVGAENGNLTIYQNTPRPLEITEAPPARSPRRSITNRPAGPHPFPNRRRHGAAP